MSLYLRPLSSSNTRTAFHVLEWVPCGARMEGENGGGRGHPYGCELNSRWV